MTERASRPAHRMQLLAERVRACEGVACVYHEGDTWARARVAEVRTDAWGVRARLVAEPTPGQPDPGRRAFDIAGSWDFLRVWPTHWSLPWVSWVVVFEPTAVEAFARLAADGAASDADARAGAFHRWLTGCLADWAPRAGAGDAGGAA